MKSLRIALLGLGLLAASPTAQAGECPWSEVTSASATMTSVMINGSLYPVRGSMARMHFTSLLSTCGEGMAQQHFTSWRSMRRATNWTFGIGMLLFWPALAATPVTAVMAGGQRSSMLTALLISNPMGATTPHLFPGRKGWMESRPVRAKHAHHPKGVGIVDALTFEDSAKRR